jgi:hypothetical protein
MKHVRKSWALQGIREKVSLMFRYIAGRIKGSRAGREKKEIIEGEEFVWVDSEEVCRCFRISHHTLQCMRATGAIGYTVFSGKIYYTLADVRRAFSRSVPFAGERMDELRKRNK